ncbi:MAG: hypothetical protein ABIR91_03815 [Candidatus Saccharimonadales bacterium]
MLKQSDKHFPRVSTAGPTKKSEREYNPGDRAKRIRRLFDLAGVGLLIASIAAVIYNTYATPDMPNIDPDIMSVLSFVAVIVGILLVSLPSSIMKRRMLRDNTCEIKRPKQ